MLSIVIATYLTVLLAELVGDKMVYTIAMLSTRYGRAQVMGGIALAYMGKMLAAVWFGSVLNQLPRAPVAAVSTLTFFAMAILLWREPAPETGTPATDRRVLSNGLVASFAAVFFSEWGDAGQITVAALVARFRLPLVVWLAASAALMTKGLIALAIGSRLSTRISASTLRLVASASCAFLGLVSLGEFIRQAGPGIGRFL